MNKHFVTLLVAAGLLASVHTPVFASAEDDMKAMEDAADRVRQGGADFRAELQKIREERKRLEVDRKRMQAQQEADRKREAEDAREQAKRDAAALASAKQEKERLALLASQERSRRDAAAKAEAAEKARQAALAEQHEKEERMARAQAALQLMKAQTGPSGYDSESTPQKSQSKSQLPPSQITGQDKAAKALQQMKAESGPSAF